VEYSPGADTDWQPGPSLQGQPSASTALPLYTGPADTESLQLNSIADRPFRIIIFT